MRLSGPTLSEVELPPSAPQPSVSAGTSPVVAPIPPSVLPPLTMTRETGMRAEKWAMISSFCEWMEKVCPAPS